MRWSGTKVKEAVSSPVISRADNHDFQLALGPAVSTVAAPLLLSPRCCLLCPSHYHIRLMQLLGLFSLLWMLRASPGATGEGARWE